MVYLEGGSGEPLMLLHGVGADKDNFLMVAGPLAKHYRVIVPDLPGFGESDRPEDASYRTIDQVERLRAFAAALGLTRFHIGGNSMGGLIAGAYAALHPEQIVSAWLLAPAGVKAAKPSPLMQALDAGQPLQIFARTIEETKRLLAFVTYKPPYMPHFMLAYATAQQQRGYSLNRRVVDQLVEGPWLDELVTRAPDMRALIVWGDQDRALDVSGAYALGSLLPNAQVIVLPDIGHVPMIEAPRRAVRDYLVFRENIQTRTERQAVGITG
jgi:pimeloyl-ACP methyl ester carboxylesterase